MSREDLNQNPVVIIQSRERGYYYRFHQLQEIIVSHSPDTVLKQLAVVESAVNDRNLFAGGFICYEAAPAFDKALKIHSDGGSIPGSAKMPILWFGLFEQRTRLTVEEVVALGHQAVYELGEWRPSISQNDYGDAISRIHDYIAEGETYQVNFSFRLEAAFQGAPLAFFADLIQAQEPQYGAFIETADFAVCSASPELFFSLEGRTLTSKPMKGTAARGLTQTADRDQAAWLQASTKNRAENVMIVDMIRNDIGRIAEIGTVQVPELFAVERYPTVWQMTSTVTGQTGATVCEILKALFPCASITGAPKVRTMEIISELETEPRQLYTGCVGFMGPGREAQFNVAIRTATIDKAAQEAMYGVGGGIVWDSEIGDEYEECQVKARILTERRPSFDLLETMLWTPEEGIFLFEEHLDRLADSADYFGYRIDIRQLSERFAGRMAELPKIPHKIRLLLNQVGEVDIQTIPMETSIEFWPNTLRIDLCAEPVDSGNVFLYHKTTHREVYEQARASRPECDDVILWNERGEITEATIANIVVKLGGRWLTPPISSGLLAGTYRNYLLGIGQIEEQVIYRADLEQASEIFLINSVQSWRRAEWVSRGLVSPSAVPR